MSRVYVTKCVDYSQRTVESALSEGLSALGVDELIRPGQRVVLKANLLSGRDPEMAVTTHPSVVAAVARWVIQLGATPIIADSPGGPMSAAALMRVYEGSGMTRVADDTGSELAMDLETVRVACQHGKALSSVDALRVFAEADAIICLPKLKTHDLALLTGAVKNLFGTVPGMVKGAYHARFPTVDRFSAMLVDILLQYKPVLTVMDAVVGMEGNGPSAGKPRHMGVLLVSRDAVAVDVAAAAIVGVDPMDVHVIRAAVRRGLSTGRVKDIEWLGSSLTDVQIEGFELPRSGSHRLRMVPDSVPNWLTEQLLAKPISGPQCTGCGVCVESCPVGAITLVQGHARPDYRACIRCYCCNELCPENAMMLHEPWLARLVDAISKRL